MPQKKAKNQGSMGSAMRYQERQKIGDGTLKVRYGVDSQLSFGYCALTLAPVVEPMVSPSGHMYSREAIYEYLLTKNKDLKRQQALYEVQQERLAAEAEERAVAEGAAELDAFIDGQTSVVGVAMPAGPAKKRKRAPAAEEPPAPVAGPAAGPYGGVGYAPPLAADGTVHGYSASYAGGPPSSSTALVAVPSTSTALVTTGLGSVPLATAAAAKNPKGQFDKTKGKDTMTTEEIDAAEREEVIANLSKPIGDASTQSQLKRTSYWCPTFAPNHVKQELVEPPKRPASPMSGEPLRLKDLFAVNLEVDRDTQDTLDKKYVCAVSKKQITFQAAVVIKKSNAVVLGKVYKDLVKPTMTCPITGEKLRKKDIIELVKPGSSFASGGSVESSVYRHTVT